MRKNVVKSGLILAAFICILFVFSGCVPIDENGFQYYKHGSTGYEFLIGPSYNPEMTEVVIPDIFRESPVTQIGQGFHNNLRLNGDGWRTGQTDRITSITIPSTINRIMAGAFRECISLEKIIIAEDNPVYKSEGNCVIEIETNKLVATCGSSDIPDYVVEFYKDAFCDTYIQNKVTDNSVFYFNNWLIGYKGYLDISLVIKPGTLGIVKGALSGADISNLVLPSSLACINRYAFANISTLSSVFIPRGVEQIYDDSFYNCPGLRIYTEYSEKPENWYHSWDNNCPVVWDFSLELYLEIFVV